MGPVISVDTLRHCKCPMEKSALDRITFSPSAAYRVPEELWATVFKLFYNSFHDDDPFFGPPLMHPSHPLQIITNVCRSWRDIIESQPTLWTRIALLGHFWLVPKEDVSAYIATKHRMLSNILCHSRNLPLQIVVEAPDPHLCPLLFTFLLLIAEYSHRWIGLSIRDNEGSSINRALTSAISLLSIEGLPSLEDLAIGWVDLTATDALNTAQYSRLGTINLPKLCRVRFSYRYVPRLVGWEGVKEVEFLDVPLAERWAALRSSSHSSIETISVIVENGDDDEDEGNIQVGPPFTLSALERLRVHGSANSGVSPMTAPRLRELVIDGMVSAEEMERVTSFIKRSECLLTAFDIPYIYSEEPTTEMDLSNAMTALIPCLSAVKSLHLGLDWHGSVEVFASALSQTKDGRWCNCHTLEHLRFTADSILPSTVSLGILIDMIEKRWQVSHSTGLSGLRKVEGLRVALSTYEEDLENLRRLEAMEAEGLVLV